MRAPTLPLVAACVAALAQLPPAPAAASTAVVGAAAYVTPGYSRGGPHWVGAPYVRPWPGYYAGWRYPYPGYGYGYGYGFGYGLGWNAGWAAWPRWNWGAAYVGPSFYPYAVTPAYLPPLWNEEAVFVQAPPPAAAAPAPPAPQAPAYWYYCTEPAGYHPYVTQCRRPWIAVQPVIPSPVEPRP